MMNRQTTTILIRLTFFAAALALLPAGAVAQDEPVLPTVSIVSPQTVVGQLEAAALQATVTFEFQADYAAGEPISSFRTLLEPAILPSGDYADTKYEFEQNLAHLVPFDDAQWSAWQDWPAGASTQTATFADLPQQDDQGRTIYYLFACQVMAADGAVSLDRAYGHQVANFRISSNLAPMLAVHHPLLGTFQGSGPYIQRVIDLLGGIPGEFVWLADVAAYGGTLVSYRWGWDVADPDDPNDPGWALPPGLSEAHRRTGPIPFQGGIHTLIIDVRDATDALTRMRLILDFVPVPAYEDQFPLLLVDDVNDHDSNQWPDDQGTPRDRDEYRDAFWNATLGGPGGVAGFVAGRDVIDTREQPLGVRDLVAYRAVVWAGRWVAGNNSTIGGQLRPLEAAMQVLLRYNWLGAYQERVGNLLFCSNRAANSLLPESPYMLPVVLASPEGGLNGYDYVDGVHLRVGFGQIDLGDGPTPAYSWLHPHRDLGLAALDITSPNAAYYTPAGDLIGQRRKAVCAGLKGLALDADFAADHMPGGPAFADTIWSDPVIDWRDTDPDHADDLAGTYVWGNDEFYDADILGRDAPFTPQDCDGTACVEPMLRMIARYDWNRQQHLAADPDDQWPQDYYSEGEIDQYCGVLALDPDQAQARTTGQTTAFVTHKFAAQKPSQKGDVVLGFDPYRFDHQPMQQAIHWILGEHFGLTMTP